MSSPNVLAELEVRIGADIKALEKRLTEVEGKSKESGKKAGKLYASEFAKTVAKDLNNLGNTLTMGVTLPIIAAMGKAMHAASALEEQQSGVEQTFKSSADVIKEFGKVRLGGITARVSILRNHERWKEVDASLIRTELSRGPQQPAFGPGGARAYLDNLTAV